MLGVFPDEMHGKKRRKRKKRRYKLKRTARAAGDEKPQISSKKSYRAATTREGGRLGSDTSKKASQERAVNLRGLSARRGNRVEREGGGKAAGKGGEKLA